MSNTIDIRKIRSRSFPDNSNKNEKSEAKDSFWSFLNKDIRLRKTALTDKARGNFYQELWSLLEAGVDIKTALDLVKDEQKKKGSKKVFTELQDQVISGSSLSSAMKKSKEFSSYEFHSVQIGEESGKLLKVLKELSVYFEKKIKQRRQIIGSVTYPAIVLMVAFAAVSFMVAFVVPMFADTFKRFGSDLPAITKIVIALSAFIKKFISLFLLLITGVVVFCYWQADKVWFRKASSSILLRLPVIGKIIQRIYLSRFSNTMSLLIGAKIPLVQAIQLTRQMITFYPIEYSLRAVEEKILSGIALHKSLNDFPVYPSKMISIVKVGEEVNQLELFFSRLSEQYASEVEYQTAMLSKFLEPIIIILLGFVVGIILIAMYLPLFRLGQSF